MKECIKKNKLLLVLTVLLNLIISVAAVFVAKLMQRVIDAAVSGDRNAFTKILVISVLYILLLGIFSFFYSLCSKKLICRLTRMLRQRSFSGIFGRNLQDFTDVNTADYISALTNDIKLIEDNYLLPSLLMLQYSVMFIVTLIMLFEISPLITLCLIGCMLVMLIVPSILGVPLQTRQEKLSKQLSVMTSKLKDFLSGYEVIKSYQMEEHVTQDFVNENDKVTAAKYRADRLFALNESISGVLAIFTQFSGIFIGAYLIIQGKITAGTLIAIIQLSSSFVSPVMMIFENLPKIQSIRPVIQRINALMQYGKDSGQGTATPSFDSEIAIRALSFSYGGNQPVLKDLDLTLYKNKKYAIVGKSGCGKTTLVKLLAGNYGTYEGDISFDGTDMRELDLNKLQNKISVIHQNVYMFDDSIRQNICLYLEFSGEETEEALKISGAVQFLDDMPDGLATRVGENGANLSGGQRQRIAVARALIRRKPILILDEGTSAVDMQTAYDMESRLLAIDDLTLFTITHNMSEDLLKKYNQIIYMEDGAVAETGSLSELLKKEGKFYQFYHLQEL